jgi:hypothetical protein
MFFSWALRGIPFRLRHVRTAATQPQRKYRESEFVVSNVSPWNILCGETGAAPATVATPKGQQVPHG